MSCLKERKRRELHLDKRPDLFIVVQGPQQDLSTAQGGSPDRRGRLVCPSLFPFRRLIDIFVRTPSSLFKRGDDHSALFEYAPIPITRPIYRLFRAL